MSMRMASPSPSQRRPRASASTSQFSVCPISSSSESETATASASQRRASQWSCWSSSDEEDEDEEEKEERVWREDDEYEDFAAVQRMSERAPASAAKLDRLRRIFLNMPSKETTRRASGERRRKTTAVKTRKSVGSSSTRSGVATRSNSSESEREKEQTSGPVRVTLAIGQHVKALSDHVQRLARQHDAHAQQWQTTLSQAVDELKFIKQQEERTLQSHVEMLKQTYALRLEVFEQQYRAKVAEIRDEMQAEIAYKRQQSESAIMAAAQRLQQETQQLVLPLEPSDAAPPVQTSCATLAKTAQFLERPYAREATRTCHTKPSGHRQTATEASLSPVTRQRTKLRLLEQKLATFSPRTVERVTNTVESQCRQRKAAVKEEELREAEVEASGEQERRGQLKPTPVSPLRKRGSYWRNGISWEERGEQGARGPGASLSRRFLRPEEERELLMLRNSIGLAKDWMEQHHTQ